MQSERQSSDPIRSAMRTTASACLAGSMLLVIAGWIGLTPARAEGTVLTVAVVLGLWATLLSLVALVRRPRG